MTSNPFNKRMENLYMKLGKDTKICTISKKLEKLEASAVGTQVACGICGGPHENHNCMSIQDDQFIAEQVNFVNNQPRPP
ncbi:hypothetical protein PIB30_100633 [Stylosanthes scabra]|uniref:Uncharacterized protein n=1 Tax=Stylosanthes scabra TaxID=79078 RepID=A0ABU6WYV7_9FABA|nr:hypothetical protein [Stylosanthes scabra]